MKKKWMPPVIASGAAALLVVLYWNWPLSKKSRLESGSGFDAAGFVSDQERLLADLADACLVPESRQSTTCAEWSMVHWAWTSQAPAGMLQILGESCSSGSKLSCDRLRRIEKADREQAWLKLQPAAETGGDAWPRVALLQSALSISEWQELAVQGALANTSAGVDLACGLVSELPETLTCVTRGNRQMNHALGRVVSYIEQGKKLLSHEEHRKNPLLRFWQGFNLRRDDFDFAVSLLRKSGPPLPEEKRMWNWMESMQWKYFLSFSAASVFTGVPSHEFLHGLYFQSDDFRSVVETALTESQLKLRRLKFFVQKIFDTDDSYILNNESQAYLLQHQSFFTDPKSDAVRYEIVRRFERNSKNVDLSAFMMGY